MKQGSGRDILRQSLLGGLDFAVAPNAFDRLQGTADEVAACSLETSRSLLHRYADRPMGFADSTLVVLAQELGTNLIFSIDKDFEIYRFDRHRTFKIVPDLHS